MPDARRGRLLLALLPVTVAIMFGHALFGGGSLVSHDIVAATSPPFDSYLPDDFSLENGPGDTIAIHAHWADLGGSVRDGDVGWWNPDLAGGQPTMKGGAPVFAAPYLVVPDWYAPGLVAALRTLVAMLLTVGLARGLGLSWAASVGGAIAYGFSGFMVGWMNWPQSSVAAFAPGLLWAVESIVRDPRRWKAAPLGACVAAMVWASFPAVAIYLVFATTVYAALRIGATVRAEGIDPSWARSAAITTGLAVAITATLSLPYLLGFQEYLAWGDTTYRVDGPADSSAGLDYLLTLAAPAAWGSDAVGPAWFGEGNWVEFNAYAGASVVLVAVFGIVAGLRADDHVRRSVARGLAAFVVLGAMIAYVGGPIGVLLGDLTGPLGGLMTRAKVLLAVGLAIGAALGIDRLWAGETDLGRLRSDAVRALAAIGLMGVVLAPALIRWVDAMRTNGVVKEVASVSAVPLLAATITIGLLGARLSGRASGTVVAPAVALIFAGELLVFAIPVPTTVSESERLAPTPAHADVLDALGPGERLGGEGRTFFVATGQLFDIPDVRGHLLKSTGYQELLRHLDPAMITSAGGGTPTNPNVPVGTDPRRPVLRAMGVGAWAQFPDSRPIGTVVEPEAWTRMQSFGVTPGIATIEVPDGGLRAIVVPVSVEPGGGTVTIDVSTGDARVVEERQVAAHEETISLAILGEDLPVGSPVQVTLWTDATSARVGVLDDGTPDLGWVAGDDDLQLVRVGDVTLFDVPGAGAWLASEVRSTDDPIEAADLVDTGAVVSDVPLATVAEGIAPPTPVHDIRQGRDEVVIRVDADAPSFLATTIADYPGWRATIDGEPAEIVTANGAFIGIEVPEGEHEVVLEFRPRRLGLFVGSLMVGVALCAAVGWSPTRRWIAVRRDRPTTAV